MLSTKCSLMLVVPTDIWNGGMVICREQEFLLVILKKKKWVWLLHRKSKLFSIDSFLNPIAKLSLPFLVSIVILVVTSWHLLTTLIWMCFSVTTWVSLWVRTVRAGFGRFRGWEVGTSQMHCIVFCSCPALVALLISVEQTTYKNELDLVCWANVSCLYTVVNP